MRKLKLVSIATLSILCLVIILQNTREVETRLLFLSIKMPLAFLLFLTALLGFLVGVLVSFRTLHKKDVGHSTPTKAAEPTAGK